MKKTYSIPFAYEKYGRIEVEADSLEAAYDAAEKELEKMDISEMDASSSYSDDSAEIDREGLVLDGNGNIIE